MNQSKLKTIFGCGAIASAVIFVVLLLVALFAVEEWLFVKVMLFVVAALFLALAIEFGYMFLSEKDSAPNYFLYIPQEKRNIPVQKLSFQMINNRMNRYLSGYAASEGKLWTDRIFDNPYLEMEDKFKPAVAYKLLYDLAERDAEPGWRCFEIASDETVDFLCAALERNSDHNLARTIRMMKKSQPINMKQVRDYIVNNKDYLKGKLRQYILENIELFMTK